MSLPARRVRVVGIGAGHPDQVTLEAVAVLETVDVFLVTDKAGAGTDDLVAVREEVLRRHVRTPHRVVHVSDPPRDRSSRVDVSDAAYERAVVDWHEERAAAYERLLLEEVPEGGTAGLLVWGDPAFYDSTLRVVERVERRGAVVLDWDVTPGVSALQLLAARHRIVLNDIGGPLTVTTGRRLLEEVDAGRDNLLVVLNRDLGPAERLAAGGGWSIWWGANLGTPGEVLVAGPLADVLHDVRAARERVRAAHGWVMDTYLLRRTPRDP